MELREFWILLSYLFLALRRAFTLAWIRLNKFMSPSVRPVTDFRHKIMTPKEVREGSKALNSFQPSEHPHLLSAVRGAIQGTNYRQVVLIGDGFAEGLGDWVVMGGMAGAARHIEREAQADDKVRMSWQIINRGRSGSVSADWLPSDDKSLYHRQARGKACKDAEIFIVTLGTMDVAGECVGMPVAALRKTALEDFTEEETCDTVKNIREICEALRAEGKRVILCNIMTTGAGINRFAGMAKRVNRQLALYARATAAAVVEDSGQSAIGAKPIVLVKLNNPRSARDDGRAFDGLHLNGRGYRAFGVALYEALGPMMVAVEWKFWKTRLAEGLTEGASRGSGVAVVAASGSSSHKTTEAKSAASKKTD